ncbi:hypothetical protein ABPG73_019111 [Tetrahymena malaccensis]
MQIQQNKFLIPTSIRSTSPQQTQTIFKQSYQLLSLPNQSLRISKSTNQSFTPPNRQYLTDRERTTNSFHQKNQKAATNDQKDNNQKQINMSQQNSPNVSRINALSQQQIGSQQNMESVSKLQQSAVPFCFNEKLTRQEAKLNNNSYKKDYSSLQTSQNYRSTQITESDQDILNIVTKYIGNKTNFNHINSKGSNAFCNQQFQDDVELVYSQNQFNLSQRSQQYYSSCPNQFDYQINKSCSYPEETQGTFQSKPEYQQQQQQYQQYQQVENYHQQISQLNQNQDLQPLSWKDQSSANNSIESQKGTNYEQMALINTEHNKQQQMAIIEQINLIKQETHKPNSENFNLKSNQMFQSNDNQENFQNYQHNIPSVQQNSQNQQDNQKVSAQNIIHKQNQLNQNIEFTECSNNYPNNQKSDSNDEEQIESDDRLNLAVYEEDNQVFDIISSDKLDDVHKQQNEHQFLEEDDDRNNILPSSALEKAQSKSFKSNQNNIQILDPIQEEDFLSRSSFDTVTIKKQLSGSFINSQNQNQINGGSQTNLINEKIELQNQEFPFVVEQELKQQVNSILNQNLISPIELQEQKNTKNEIIEEDIQLFDSNLEEIGCIIQKGCEDNLFSQDSYENYLDIYNSDQTNNQRETYKAQKNLIKQEHQRSQSDAANYSQNFQSISSFDNESLRRSINNLASFGHSPQISIQTNEQTYLNGNSATFNQENTYNSEQSPEIQPKQKLSQLIAESEKCQNIETPQIQNQETSTFQFEEKETKSSQKKLTFQDTIKRQFIKEVQISSNTKYIKSQVLEKQANYFSEGIYLCRLPPRRKIPREENQKVASRIASNLNQKILQIDSIKLLFNRQDQQQLVEENTKSKLKSQDSKREKSSTKTKKQKYENNFIEQEISQEEIQRELERQRRKELLQLQAQQQLREEMERKKREQEMLLQKQKEEELLALQKQRENEKIMNQINIIKQQMKDSQFYLMSEKQITNTLNMLSSLQKQFSTGKFKELKIEKLEKEKEKQIGLLIAMQKLADQFLQQVYQSNKKVNFKECAIQDYVKWLQQPAEKKSKKLSSSPISKDQEHDDNIDQEKRAIKFMRELNSNKDKQGSSGDQTPKYNFQYVDKGIIG